MCEEWCPTSPKAIYLRPAEVTDAAGAVKKVRQPYVEPSRCVGCGACEFACPVADRPAIYVTSIGESRSKTNQILLRQPKSPAKAADLFPASGEVQDWTKTEETRTFPADRLWEYVDGDANRYLQAGIKRTLAAPYKFRNRFEAMADIHIMKSPESARRIFESESATGSRAAGIGDASRLYSASLTFRKGACFVRLTAYEEAPQVAEGLTALARGIEKKIGIIQ